MRSGIGSLLRVERERRGIELSDVEVATRIRAELLSAIEAEDWDRLPGEAYARGFVRTYAGFLGVDPEPWLGGPPQASGLAPLKPERAKRRGWPLAAAVAMALVLAVAVAALVSSGSGGSSTSTGSGGEASVGADGSGPAGGGPGSTGSKEVALSLKTTAELWVCLLDGKGRPLVDGIVLPEGAEEGPFRSGSFTVSFGNGEVEMRIDGRDSEIPDSGSPLGYEIGRGGELSPLGETERPTCT